MKNDYEVRGEITVIFLERRDGDVLETIISSSDLEKVKLFPHRWRASYSDSAKSFYVYGSLKKKAVKLHRWIMDPEKEIMVDHINHNTLDNTRENLRLVTGTGNQLNKNAKGVYFDHKRKLWIARLQVNGVRKVVGNFETEEAAVNAAFEARKNALDNDVESVDKGIYNKSKRLKRERTRSKERHIS